MTANEFRRLALSFPEAIEAAHMGHPDFRVGDKDLRRKGSTTVRLAAVPQSAVREALTIAWRNRAPKRLAEQLDP